jgi:hypothetical protein
MSRHAWRAGWAAAPAPHARARAACHAAKSTSSIRASTPRRAASCWRLPSDHTASGSSGSAGHAAGAGGGGADARPIAWNPIARATSAAATAITATSGRRSACAIAASSASIDG